MSSNNKNNKLTTRLPTLSFNTAQAAAIERYCQRLATEGGPHAAGSAIRANTYASVIADMLSKAQVHMMEQYAQGKLPALLFIGMKSNIQDIPPETMPSIQQLDEHPICIKLASRNQLLLSLVQHAAFAYDIDNDGKTTRLVGNFRGGGATPLPTESTDDDVELSSHAGLSLGPHTEPPYYCSRAAMENHSPAPCALILTARWNPRNEPTRIIPMKPVIDRLPGCCVVELTSKSFQYTRSDCFVQGTGEPDGCIPILQHDCAGTFAIRYNDYRFSTSIGSSPEAQSALSLLKTHVHNARKIEVNIQPCNTLLINNTLTLHCRDTVSDNRRLLIRLFGYSSYARPIVLNSDPLIVKG